MSRCYLWQWIVCIGIIATACGSNTVEKTSTRGVFTPDITSCSAPPSNSVYLCRNNKLSNDNVIAVDVILNSKEAVFGIAFDIIFDPEKVEVVRKADHSVDFSLPENTVWKHTLLALPEDQNSALIVGAIRQEKEPLNGIFPVVTLKFKLPYGQSPLTFSNNNIVDLNGHPIDVFKNQWHGGYFD